MDKEGFQNVVSKAIQAFKAAEAAKKARELVRRKSVLTNSTLPGRFIKLIRNMLMIGPLLAILGKHMYIDLTCAAAECMLVKCFWQ